MAHDTRLTATRCSPPRLIGIEAQPRSLPETAIIKAELGITDSTPTTVEVISYAAAKHVRGFSRLRRHHAHGYASRHGRLSYRLGRGSMRAALISTRPGRHYRDAATLARAKYAPIRAMPTAIIHWLGTRLSREDGFATRACRYCLDTHGSSLSVTRIGHCAGTFIAAHFDTGARRASRTPFSRESPRAHYPRSRARRHDEDGARATRHAVRRRLDS
jgi:hypothetical protein